MRRASTFPTHRGRLPTLRFAREEASGSVSSSATVKRSVSTQSAPSVREETVSHIHLPSACTPLHCGKDAGPSPASVSPRTFRRFFDHSLYFRASKAKIGNYYHILPTFFVHFFTCFFRKSPCNFWQNMVNYCCQKLPEITISRGILQWNTIIIQKF